MRLKSLKEFLNKDFKLDYLAEPIVPKKQLILLVGRSGSFKSTLTLYFLNQILKRLDFLGFKTAFPDKPALYLNRDDPASILQDQFKRLGLVELDEGLNIWDLSEDEPFPLIYEYKKQYHELAEKHSIMVFDNLGVFTPGKDENVKKDIAMAMDVLRSLCNYTTPIVLHHTGKTETSKIYRGHSHIFDSAHVVLHLKKIKDSETKAILHLTCQKSKVAPLTKEKYLEIVFDKNINEFRCNGWKNQNEDHLTKIAKVIKNLGKGSNQGQIIETSPFSKGYTKHLLQQGVGRLWEAKAGQKKEIIYKLKDVEIY